MRSNANTSDRRPSGRKSFPLGQPAMTGGRRSAFTLVELLVVVGVIALLVSILMPVLDRARESAYSAKCRSNLKQLWTYFQHNQIAGAITYPTPQTWRGTVSAAGGEKALYCPKDKFTVIEADDLDKLYFVQNGSTFCYFNDIAEGNVADNQLTFVQLSDNRYLVAYLAGEYFCARFIVTLGDPVKIEVPSDESHEEATGGCGSHHYACYDADEDGHADWQNHDLVIEGKGDDDNGPCGVPGFAYVPLASTTSYAMNAWVPTVPPDANQLLLLDYEKVIADPFGLGGDDPDDWDEELEPATKRHLGRVNVIDVSGKVFRNGMSRPELQAEKDLDDQGIWKINP